MGCAMPAAAADSALLTTVRSLGIIQSNEYGVIAYSGTASRGEFARMLVAAQDKLNTVSATLSTSPFRDVKYDHAYAGYIKSVTADGLMSAYLDGSFRPDSGVKLEEAAGALLKLLGYTESGSSAAIEKARSIGLLSGISKTQGQVLTINDCVDLFVNLLSAKTSGGNIYAASVGLATSSGQVDHTAAVTGSLEGPYLCEGTLSSAVPFSMTGAEIYLNGSKVSASDIDQYDVIYYNTSMKTVWAYRKRVTGTYTAASPSTASPSSVTVAGQSCSVSGSAAYTMSDLSGIALGDTVTLLLGRDGTAVFAVSGSVTSVAASETGLAGVVTCVSTTSYTNAYGKDIFPYTASVICTDGVLRRYEIEDVDDFKEGNVVTVDGTTLTRQRRTTLSGMVNDLATTVGKYNIASDVQVLDYVSSGSYAVIYRSGLADLKLSSGNVLYYGLNSNGEIGTLLLKDATGEAGSYGLVTSVEAITTDGAEELEYSSNVTGYTVTYLLNGQAHTTVMDAESEVSRGGVSFTFENGQLSSTENLKWAAATRINGLKATMNSGTANIADDAAVYVKIGSDYYETSLDTVRDISIYDLTCYYDKSLSTGGKVRVIVAEEK